MRERVLVGGVWRDAIGPSGLFHALDPLKREPLGTEYPISGMPDIVECVEAAREAARELCTVPPGALAGFLEQYADLIDRNRREVAEMASLETALPLEPRLLSIELPRMSNQLRQAAAAARDRSWCRATIDSRLNIRSKYAPLGGAVVVIGPGNFPLAFNAAAGGDFAAAVAAGNPVIAKAHPSHPGTARVLAGLAFDALLDNGLPPATLQLLYHVKPKDGLQLVSHPRIGATAFTGSRASGLALKAAAEAAGKPIYLEMSSVNPVFVLPGALKRRLGDIAQELAASCALAGGQFCTKPGLLFLPADERVEEFISSLGDQFNRIPPAALLAPQIVDGIQDGLRTFVDAGAAIVAGGCEQPGGGYRHANTLLRTTGAAFLRESRAFQKEAFGPVMVAVVSEDEAQMVEIAEVLEGNLTATIYSDLDGGDDTWCDRLSAVLRPKVGRLLNDKAPTGVAVIPAMCHGGPYPAAGHPGFTSVGTPASMLRFAALHCYDNVRQHRLPDELRDKNPTGRMWRLIDGEWSQSDVPPAHGMGS